MRNLRGIPIDHLGCLGFEFVQLVLKILLNVGLLMWLDS
jgi:hypothetical protein